MKNICCKSSAYLIFAIFTWIIPVIVISILVYMDPSKHSVTSVYHEAVEKWMSGQQIYSSAYHYFPQFVFVFLPFHLLPMPFADILWCMVQTGLLSWALWRLIALSPALKNEALFLFASLFVIAQSFGAMRNGQANVLFAALTVHAAVCLARSRWGLAAFCLVVALAVKPIGMVMIALSIVVYRPLITRLAIGIGLFLALPLITADPAYVLSQYKHSIQHLVSFSLVSENRFADINGLLRALGMEISGILSQFVRIAAGLLTLVLWMTGARNTREPERAWLLLGLSAAYLMLFNPMTEGNSYVIVAPCIAVYAIRFLKMEVCPKIGWSLVFMGLSLGLLPEIVRRLDPTFSLWWSPLMMLFFAAILMITIFSKNHADRESFVLDTPVPETLPDHV